METALHPSNFIDPGLIKFIRKFSFEAEKQGELLSQHMDLIHKQNWLNMFVPGEYNGLGLSLIEGLKIEEGLAFADGSMGWMVTLCSGAAWFSGYIKPEVAIQLFDDSKVCFAGSGQTGTAFPTENGYEVSGQWKYVSGASHATVFTANCSIRENDVLLKNEDGCPEILSFLFLREEVTIIKDWESV